MTEPPRLHAWLLVPLVAAVGIAYRPALEGPFLFDDIDKIEMNASLHDFPLPLPSDPAASGAGAVLRDYLNRWVLGNTYAWDADRPGGLDPAPFRRTNLVIHAGNLLLLAALLGRFGIAWPVRFLLLLLWGLHPIQSQAVAYISGRSSSLVTACVLGSILCWLEALDAGRPRRRRIAAAGALTLFLLGLGVKETAVVTPVLALLAAWGSGRPLRPLLRKRSAAVALAGMGLGVLLILSIRLRPSEGIQGRGVTGAQTEAGIGRAEYFWTQQKVIATRYLPAMIFPSPNIDPDVRPERMREGAGEGIAAMLLLLAVGGLLAWRALRGGSAMPLAGYLWFGAALAPTSSFVPLLDAAAEHRTYLASVGFLLALSVPVRRAAARAFAPTAAALALVALLFGWRTIHRADAYRSELPLWRDAAREGPRKGRPRVAIAQALFREADLAGAIGSWERSARVEPRYGIAQLNLGMMAAVRGRLDDAEGWFAEARQNKPDYLQANAGLLRVILGQEEFERALAFADGLERMLGPLPPEIAPLAAAAHRLLPLRDAFLNAPAGSAQRRERRQAYALALGEAGHVLGSEELQEAALDRWEEISIEDPDDGIALRNAAQLHEELLRHRTALALWRRALTDADPHVAAAIARLVPLVEEPERGIAIYTERVRANREDPDGWFRLGEALWYAGRVREARDCWQEAIRRTPRMRIGPALKRLTGLVPPEPP